MIIARELNIPCLTYAHEHLLSDQDHKPHGCSSEFYLKLINSLSNHLLCASVYVQRSFPDQGKCSVLYPFEPHEELHESHRLELETSPISLLVIGTKSRRKNTHFAITVLKALRLRGLNLSLHIIGSENSGSYKLRQQASIREEKNVFIHPHLEKPFNIPGRKINLVCSHSEPFGLTISESLALGIPIMASRSGGPEEILSAEFLYQTDNVDECVRSIERVAGKYAYYSALSKSLYLKIAEKNNFNSRISVLSKAIELAFIDFKNSPHQDIILNLEYFKKISTTLITTEEIMHNISDVSIHASCSFSVAQIRDLVNDETNSPGSAVLKDVHEFDVVPYGHSANMNRLYKNGLGLAIELLANIKDLGKQQMLAYIVLKLQELSLTNQDLKILCLGDGLGVESIILADCGFNVDYIDFDQSLMSKCAELNFKTAIKNSRKHLSIDVLNHPKPPYDAIISLEVIEHVPNPGEFLKYLSENLIAGGLLFISECFDGIYNQWPTHLYLNEEYASSLPVLAAPYFNLIDINTSPLGKPYLFSKNLAECIHKDSFKFFDDTTFLNSMGNAKSKIGF